MLVVVLRALVVRSQGDSPLWIFTACASLMRARRGPPSSGDRVPVAAPLRHASFTLDRCQARMRPLTLQAFLDPNGYGEHGVKISNSTGCNDYSCGRDCGYPFRPGPPPVPASSVSSASGGGLSHHPLRGSHGASGGGAGAVGGGGAESEDTVALPSIHIPNTYGPT